MPSVARLLAHRRQLPFKNSEVFFAFCDVILGISNIYFENNMQSMIKIWI